MAEIPIDIPDLETVARGIFSPYHLKGNKPIWQAFRPPPASTDVSVMRRDHMGHDACLERGRSMGAPQSSPPKLFRGLALICAMNVRAAGSDVVDSRQCFPGHADIQHKFSSPPPGVLPTPAELALMREVCLRLLDGVEYHPDGP
jgi:hypothetical protein